MAHQAFGTTCNAAHHLRGRTASKCVFAAVSLLGTFATSPAMAFDIPEYGVLQGTDTKGKHPLTFNTAAQDPKLTGFSFAEQVRTKNVRFKRENGTDTALTESNVDETMRGIEISADTGGLIFGIGLNHSSTEYQSTNDQSNSFEETPLLETLKRSEAKGKFSLELTKDLRAGGLVRYRYVESDALGNFFMPLNERTKHSGGLLGAGAGAQFNAQSAAIALQYLSPLEGKVEILGEEKIISEPGLISVCGHFDAFAAASVGGCYMLAQHTKDELRTLSTGPNPANQTQVAPKGVNPESFVHLVSAAMAGVDFHLGQAAAIRISGSREQYERILDTQIVPKGESDAAEKFDGYRARLSFRYATDNVFAEIGADGAHRQKSFDRTNNGQSDSLEIREYNFFGTLGIGF